MAQRNARAGLGGTTVGYQNADGALPRSQALYRDQEETDMKCVRYAAWTLPKSYCLIMVRLTLQDQGHEPHV